MGKALAYTNEAGEASFLDPQTGEAFWVPKAKAQQAADAGYVPETRVQFEVRQRKQMADDPASAALYGAARGATLGLSDVVLSKAGLGDYAQELKKHNPIASTAGEVGGSIASALIPGGAINLAGRAGSKAAKALVGRVSTKGLAARVAQHAPKAGAVVAEGAAQGAGAGVSDAALTGDWSPTKIAEKAIIGGATGATLSLAGIGIVGLGKVAQRAAYKAAGTSVAEHAALKATKAALQKDAQALAAMKLSDDTQQLMKGLRQATEAGADDAVLAAARAKLADRLGSWRPASGVAPELVSSQLSKASQAVEAAQAAVFEAAAGKLQNMRGLLGGSLGFSTESWLLGAAGFHAGDLLKKAGARKALTLSAQLVTGTAKAAARPARQAAIAALTHDDIKQHRKALDDQDPVAVHRAALNGYAAGGVEPHHAQELARFQSARLELLKQSLPKTDRASERMRYSKIHAAATDPQSILKRYRVGGLTIEDVIVLDRLFPKTAAQLRQAALELLDGGRLSRQQVRNLRMLTGKRSASAGVVQASISGAQKKQPPRGGRLNINTGQSPLERMAGRGGLLGR